MTYRLLYQCLALVGLLTATVLTVSCIGPSSNPPEPLIGNPAVVEVLSTLKQGIPMRKMNWAYCIAKGEVSHTMTLRLRGGSKGRLIKDTQVHKSTLEPSDSLGRGAPYSDHMALFWFQKAADQRNALAFAKLGMMYERGRAVPQSLIDAHMLVQPLGCRTVRNELPNPAMQLPRG
ncbi:MAG: hypothetical protein QM706_03910 [Nitrospira sp.]